MPSNGQGVYPIDMETAAEGPGGPLAFPSPAELWARTFPATGSGWRGVAGAVRGGPVPGQEQDVVAAVLPGDRRQPCAGGGRGRPGPGAADAGDRHGQDVDRVSDRLEAVRGAVEPDRLEGAEGEPKRRPRILFLADRNGLANQAFSDFTSFAAFNEDDLVRIAPDAIKKKGRCPRTGRSSSRSSRRSCRGRRNVVRGREDAPEPVLRRVRAGLFRPDHHRRVPSRRGEQREHWRGILDYFKPAMQLGLTATPKRKDNVDTYKYFGDPLYIYSLKDGINDGFLTPFRVKQYSTTLDEYVYTSDDQVIEGEVEVGHEVSRRRTSTSRSRSASAS